MARKNSTITARSSGNGSTRQAESHYFLSLSLRNVRCFGSKTQTLDLSDGNGRPAPWTILLGNNGTGKTTVLQSLVAYEVIIGTIAAASAGMTGSSPAFRSRVSQMLDEISLWRGVGKTPGVVQVVGGASRNLADRIVDQWEVELKPRLKEIEFRPPPRGKVSSPFAYGAGRRTSSSRLASERRDDPLASLFSEDASLRNAEEWLLQLDYAASKTKQEQFLHRLQQVKKLLAEILPDVSDTRFTQPKEESPTTVVEFHTPYGWVPLRGISYGYQTLITWMVDFASRMLERYPDSADPLAEPAVCVVDEIDLHLHPSWQRKLMSYLSERFPNTQFIATAHSPLIVQAAPSVNANIAVLRREGDHVVIDNDVEAVRGWRVDQILTSELFDLPTARPAEFDEALKRRTELLGKPRLTKADREELKRLESRLDQLPPGGSDADARKWMALAQDTNELLKKYQGQGK